VEVRVFSWAPAKFLVILPSKETKNFKGVRMKAAKIYLHQGDLPDSVQFADAVAVDTETMGLVPHRDRLCLVQLADDQGNCHLVQLNRSHTYSAPNLCRLLVNSKILKIFHFARFDIASLYQYLNVLTAPVYCTKVASKLTRNYAPRHGLKNLVSEILDIEISKQARTSDWGSHHLNQDQLHYAATDVLHLHELKIKLDELLIREHRQEIAQACFDFLPTCALLDLLGYEDLNIFRHD
jgi:ribonuclease D